MSESFEQAHLPLDAQGCISVDVQCLSCGYNLRGLLPGGKCPECGIAVSLSARGEFLRFSDPRWVATLAGGMKLVLAGIVAAIVLPAVAGPGLAILLATPVALIGFWKVTQPDPREAGQAKLTARRISRYAWTVCCAMGPLQYCLALADFVFTFAALVIAAVFGFAAVVSTLSYAQQLANRIPDKDLVDQARFVMWGWMTMALLIAIAVLGLWAEYLTGLPHFSLISSGLALGLAPVFLIWTAVLIIRYEIALARAAAKSRSNWAALTLTDQETEH